MVKKLLSAAVGASIVLVTVAPVMAAADVNGCELNTTGPYSNNQCTVRLKKAFRFKEDNKATVNETVNSTVNSGGNSSNYNTNGSGSVAAGAADASAFLDYSVNYADVAATQLEPVADNTGLVDTSGPYSTNIMNISNIRRARVTINNTANVNHIINSSAVSGNNQASYNTVGGSVSSGDASSYVDIVSDVNTTWVEINQ